VRAKLVFREVVLNFTNSSRGFRLLILLGILLCAVSAALAQEATIVGSVTDPTGAVVPGATITLTNAETGQAWTAVSNEAGQYLEAGVRIGTYNMKCEAKGFKAWTTSGVALRVGDRARVDVKLEIGSATESITIESSVVRVQSETAEISDVVSGNQMTTMMSNGRHFAMLAALVPGASSNMGSFNFPQAGNVDISFNGANPAHNVWLTDGAENYDRGGWGTNTMPSMDAVAEFRTLTSNYSAEYGLASGATMSMAFKTGTNKLHGAGWEFLRNDNVDANDFFRNKAGSKKAPLAYNLFGFNIGGPVSIGSFNKNRDKTFFFYNMEWRKLRQYSTTTASVAPSAWYTGDLSSLTTQLYVPDASKLSASQIARFAQYGLNPGDKLVNNQIPAGLIDSNATAILSTGIMPTESYMSNGIGKWTGGSSTPNDVREEIVRIDHTFNDKFSVFGHFVSESMARTDAPATWSGGSYPTVSSLYSNPSFSFLVHATYAVTPTLLNEMAFNYSGNKINIDSNGTYARTSSYTVPEMFAGNEGDRLPVINWQKELGTTYNTWSQPWANNANTKSFRDDLSWVKGRHELKFGGQFLQYSKKQQIFGNTQGNFQFSGAYTQLKQINATTGKEEWVGGSSFADFLLGYSSRYQELALQDSGKWTNQNYTLYFQDNWRVTNRLTLNLGMRWEGMPAVVETENRMSNFYPNLYSTSSYPSWIGGINSNQLDTTGAGFQTVSGVPLSSTLFYMNGIGIAGNGVPEGLVNNSWNNWSPRIGLAYDLTGKGKTVIRAGFGRMYERVQGNDVYNGGGNSPFSYTATVYNVLLSNPSTDTASGLTASSPIYPGSITGKIQDNYKSPTSNQWSASVQHELFPRGVLSVAYVGNNAFHQSTQRDINTPALAMATERAAVVAGTTKVDRIRPYLGWGSLVMAENAGNAHYHSMQTNLRVNAAKGLDLQMAYTLSRAWNQIRNAGSGGDLGTIDNPYDRSYNNGLATWDRTHILTFNYSYELPFFKNSSRVKKALLGGWRITGITTFQSGAPSPLSYDNSSLGMGSNVTNRPDFSGEVEYTDTVVGNNVQWITKSGFSAPAAGTFGNAAKDVVRGPGRNNWDMALHKEFAGIPFINPEGATLQFRLETFNTFNHAQWSGFTTNFSSSDFGNVTGTRGPRNLQLGLKFLF
jgi:hypothetical protein